MQPSKWASRVVGPIAVAAFAFAGLVVAAPAQADTAPVDPTTEPTTVTADSLPTVQINGVVWNQQIVGNTVYVAGDFTKARPAGSAPGVNEVSRTYLLAYNLTTGVLIPSFAPVLNAQVRDLALSPDGTRLFAVGNFTSVDSQTRYRIAAFDTATGALVPGFKPTVNAPLTSVAVTSSAVYFGGTLTSVQGSARSKVAALNPSTGALLPFNPVIDNGSVTSMTAAPDGASLVIGGSFTSVNGGQSGYGLARLAASDGSTIDLPVNTYIRDGGAESGVLSLESDGTSFYGSGYHFGGGGNMEGSFSASWATGQMNWVEDCHGDTYSAFPAGNEVYSASHKHYCGNSGGFPQTDPWTYHRATATSKTVSGTNTGDIYGYPDHNGQPKPLLLNWFPTINTGTFTGKSQGPWTVNGNDSYVLYGGEFTQVNGVGQQGLARFARSNIAPDTQGPRLSGALFPLSANSFASGQVRLAWQTNYDYDNATLTYNLYRTNVNTPPIYTQTVTTPFFKPINMGFIDKGLTPGSSQRYRIEAVDPFGNLVRSDYATVTVSSSAVASPYADAVWNDNATSFWRFGETSGPDVYDWSGFADVTANAGVTRGVSGAIAGDTNTAAHFDGSDSGFAATESPIVGPQVFTIETWFKTTTTSGGKIVSFGNNNTGNSSNYDRHIYMTPAGKVAFGVYPGTSKIVTSPASYNDGVWHQAVASLGPDGQKLYVDGKRVATDASVTSAQSYSGYWRIGGDSAWEGANYFNGDIDDTSIYSSPLTAAQVDAHWVAAGRTSTIPAAPADTYGASVFNLSPDLYWRLNDVAGSATAADSGALENPGTYIGAVSYQADGAIGGANKAVTFPPTGGTHGLVTATKAVAGPTTYSEELWFKTSTTNGGKLIGFGDQTSGTSNSYDRHVYMENDGRLTFGTWTGNPNTITTPLAYNNNQWHYLVATQAADGMKLYVDGVLRGTNPQTDAQPYTGYWRIGGDNTWGPQPWFDGSIDEVAIYSAALTQDQVTSHWQIGSGFVAPNALPTAAFTTTGFDQTVNVDGTGSTDSDGTVTGYAWDFGDGVTASTPTATHVYGTAGDHTITLTVTDDDGGTAQVSHVVTTTAPNVAPNAAFTVNVNGADVSVDATASLDSDGSITGYAWTFGDGGTATGATANHTYATEGSRTITLTLTDDDGATSSTTHAVNIVFPNVAPTAAFTTSGSDLTVNVNGTSSTDSDGTVASYAWDFGDGGTAGTPTATHVYTTPGDHTIVLTVTDDEGATGQVSHVVSTTVPNAAPSVAFTSTVAAGLVNVDASTSVDSDGTITGYAWTFGDGGTATGVTASHTYTSGGTKTIKLVITDDDGATATVSHDVSIVLPNQAPIAAFSATATGLSASISTAGSSDPDGTITGYAWNFGDGTTGTGSAPTHVYGGSGTYTIVLTVTDNSGGTAQVSHDLVVTAPPANAPFAVDAFGRTVANGWGSADLGGAWTNTGTASRFSVSGGAGKVSLAAGITTTSVLSSVASTSTDLTATVSADKVPGGGGAMISLFGRRASTGDAYGARVKLYDTGAVQLHLTRPGTTLVGGTVPGLTYTAGMKLNVRLQVTGVSPTTVQAKVWKVGDAEPAAWFATFTDSATAALQAPGAIGVQTYLSSSAANGPVVFSYDDLSAKPVGAAAPNQAPTAVFTPTVNGLGLSVNASASTDPDGAITGYAWTFGDGGTGTGVTATHTYATGGPYTVTLTTTDNAGATATASTVVTAVTPPASPLFGADAFTRTVANGWGSAVTGGAWTLSGTASRFSVDGTRGRFTIPAGVTQGAYLGSVSSLSTRLGVTVGVDKVPDGGGAMIFVQGRRVANGDAYGARLKLLADGTVQLHVTRGAGTVVSGIVVPGLVIAAGDQLRVKLEVSGSSPTTVSAKVWKVGAAEPATWQATMTDSTANLQVAGAIGLSAYLAGTATVAPVVFSFDDLTAEPVG